MCGPSARVTSAGGSSSLGPSIRRRCREDPPGPGGVGGDLNNHRFHDRHRHRSRVSVELSWAVSFPVVGHGCFPLSGCSHLAGSGLSFVWRGVDRPTISRFAVQNEASTGSTGVYLMGTECFLMSVQHLTGSGGVGFDRQWHRLWAAAISTALRAGRLRIWAATGIEHSADVRAPFSKHQQARCGRRWISLTVKV